MAMPEHSNGPERIVFLDRGSLQASLRPPAFPHEWQDYSATAPSEIAERLSGATIAVTNKVPLSREILTGLPDLKLIAVAATGTDIIDLNACEDLAIAVANIRGYATNSLPEHVFALILALRRSLGFHQEGVRRGDWTASKHFCLFSHPMQDLAGSTLGLVGFGALGRSVARLGLAFKMKVIACDQMRIEDEAIREASLEEVLERSDVISLHVPLTAATRNLIDRARLKKMKRSAILINTARGGLVNEVDLADALKEGEIGGAGIDVLSAEPPAADNPLLKLHLPNLILTPHVAWASDEAMQSLADQLIDNIDAFVAGRAVNLVVKERHMA
jgi:glycerate dehydrogenase